MTNIHDEILSELEDLVKTDDIKSLRSKTYEFLPLSPLKKYSPDQIKMLRKSLHCTQSYFGQLLGVTLKTVQAWEAGTNKPNGTALRMFQVLEQDPHALDIYVLANV